MRTIEIRRHAYTKKGEQRGKVSHLSAAGVAQARHIGAQIGPFDLVLTSLIPRTLETALAMGFTVDDQLDVLGDIPLEVWDEIGHHERWAWPDPFVQFARFVARGGATARLGECQRQAWVQALESVAESSRVLIVSHGRVIEAGLVTCVPEGDFVAWGPPFQHGEGVHIVYTGDHFADIEFRRNSI